MDSVTSKTPTVRFVTMGFPLPVNIDAPSEVRSEMKALVVLGLQMLQKSPNGLTPEQRMLLDGMLTEC